MKVLYNISPVGTQHFKGGGYRITESLAEELIKRDDLEIKFCSNSILSAFDAKEYVKGKELATIDFSLPQLSKATQRVVQWHSGLMKKIHAEGASNLKKKVLKGERKIFDMLSKRLYNIDHQNIFFDPKEIKSFSLYHSVCYLPPRIFSEKYKMPTFFNHMDIIPLLFPSLYKEENNNAFKAVLDKLTKDSWILCISESSKNDLLNYMGDKLDPQKLFVTYLAASDMFHKTNNSSRGSLKKYGIPDAPYVLTLCTFDPRKNLESVIKAFSLIVKQEHITDLNLVLAGEHSFMSAEMQQVMENFADLKDRIFITGTVPDEDLVHLYNQAYMFVFPSLYEGFGLPPLEAMQCGTPVVTSNVSSLPEVVGDAAILVDPTDLDELAQAMLNIYNDQSLRHRLSQKSIERAKLFSWKKCADETVAAYKIATEYRKG